jgi:hypothetical protein
LVHLNREGRRTVRDLEKCIDETKQLSKDPDPNRISKLLGVIQKISYNVRSMLDGFVENFVREKGIQTIMELIDEAE